MVLVFLCKLDVPMNDPALNNSLHLIRCPFIQTLTGNSSVPVQFHENGKCTGFPPQSFPIFFTISVLAHPFAREGFVRIHSLFYLYPFSIIRSSHCRSVT